MGGGMRKLSFCAICALFFANEVLANENLSSEGNFTLKEVVVSATGYEQDIKDAPASISIIPKEDFLNRPIRDLGDIVNEVPGVATTVTKTGATTIQMRGMSSDYTLVLVDGKRMNMSTGFDGNGFDATSGFIPPASMIERVEVIRGPASIIYGSDAMGGVINIITKKNVDKVSASISAETRLQEHHGRWGNVYGLNGNIFVPFSESFLLNLRAKYFEGEKNRFYISEIPNYTTTSTNPYTSHSPTGYTNYSLGTRLSYFLDPYNSFYIDFDYGFQRLGSLNTSSSQVTAVREYHKYNLVLNHDGEYDFGKFNNYIQFSDTIKMPEIVGIGDDSGPANHASLVYNQAIAYGTTFTTDLDFENYGALILNMGPYFFYEKLVTRSNSFRKDAWQGAIFGEGEYLINDYVSTTAGIRVNELQTYGTHVNPRFYVNFYPSSWLTFKAGIASGLKSPALETRYDGIYDTATSSTGYDYYGNTELDPEQTLSYELSSIIESSFANFTITGFYTTFKDAINSKIYQNGEELPFGYGTCNSSVGTGCSLYENVDEAVSRGIEIAMNSKALFSNIIPRGIWLDFSYAYTETEQRTGDNKGLALNDIPKYSLFSKLTYKGTNWDLFARYSGKLKTPTDNSHTANVGPGAYFKNMHVVDLGADYRFKNGITISGVINNLFDKDFVDYFTYQGTRGTSYSNNYQRMIPGRNFWLNVRADF
ncbi:TonB-dependent receptor [Campylobacter sp. LR185c]|nr:TonB-dependent receptor [Campylobacter sp. LR185c]KAA6229732.1 TonB-dependent receptor [Campylobacter sp. LR286c]KAA8604133.1 ferric enterobactin uptake receptor [Campylobacter sp. LR185c]